MSPRRPAPARPGSHPASRGRAGGRSGTSGPSRPTTPEAAAHHPGRGAASAIKGGKGGKSESRPGGGTPAGSGAGKPPRGSGGATRVASLPAPGVGTSARALILVIALLFAFVIVFPALRGYLSQRAQYDAIQQQLADAKQTSAQLEADLAKWKDDDYVRAQARQRLFYVMPGETTYVVIGADQFEERATQLAALTDGADSKPWYQVLRDSAEVAGEAGRLAKEAAQDAATSQPSGAASTPATPAPSASPAASH